MRNMVIQTGMVFNKREVKTDTHELLFFLLSTNRSYQDKEGQTQRIYDYIQCMFSKKIGQDSPKYDSIKEHITDRSVVMIDGHLRGYYEDLSEKYDEITDKRLILKNILYVDRFAVIRKSDEAEAENENRSSEPNELNQDSQIDELPIDDDFINSLSYTLDV